VEIGRLINVAPLGLSAPGPQTTEPRHARAVLAVVERAHGDTEDVAESVAGELAGEEQVKLGTLLAELLQLKSRLRAAMPAF